MTQDAADELEQKGSTQMLLQRRKDLSHVKYEQESVDWTSYDGAEVFVDFMRFGEGSERTPFFRVLLKWEDIEAILSALAEKKHDGAIRIQRALRLADAVADLSDDSN
jgi:hypothetical protein